MFYYFLHEIPPKYLINHKKRLRVSTENFDKENLRQNFDSVNRELS